MELQIQPNSWSCFAVSFAMVARVPVEKVYEFLKTDGSEIVFSELREPLNRRSFGVNELMAFMVSQGWSVTPLIWQFEQGPRETLLTMIYQISSDFIEDAMERYDGVISGHLASGTGHAVAWNHKERKVYDPCGIIRELPALKLEMETFFLCSPL